MLKEEMEKKSVPEEGKSQKEENDKSRALVAVVVFFTLLIVILWFINTKSFFRNMEDQKKSIIDIDKISNEFAQTFNDVGQQMNELKKIDPAEIENFERTNPAAWREVSSTAPLLP